MTLTDPSVIEFTVYGKPAQQGSKSAFVRNGRAIMFEANAKAKAEWRQTVVAVAIGAMDGRELLECPVELDVTFCFRRPKSHFRSGKNSTVLKSSAPSEHTHTPDLDKLVRNIGDSLTGTVVNDDSQICSLIARRKWTDGPECALVRVKVILASPNTMKNHLEGTVSGIDATPLN